MTYPIPTAALDDRLGFVGTSGSGKTYAAGTAVERLLSSKAKVVVVDPLDVWYGLRVRANGKEQAFPVVIFGGAHADLPLTEHAGALIGQAVAGMAESCIVSLAELGSKAAERRFMLAFLEALYRKATGEPFHLIFDEADLWAPQNSLEPQLKNLMENVVRRGRVKGFIPWLITQRPAVVSKDVLSQVDGLIAMKLTSAQDRDALRAWIEGQADRADEKKLRDRLPQLKRGESVVWIPGRGVLTEAKFPEKVTFDSSSTPKRGETRRTASLKPLDVSALRTQIAALEDERAKPKGKPSADQAVTVTVPDQAALRAAEDRGRQLGRAEGERIGETRGYLQAKKEGLAALNALAPQEPTLAALPTRPSAKSPPVAPPRVATRAPAASGAAAQLNSGAQRLLTEAQSRFPVKFTWGQLAALTGRKARGGAWNTAKKQLLEGGHVSEVGGVVVPAVAEERGPMSQSELLELWVEALPSPANELLSVIAGHPRGISVAALAEATGRQPRGGSWNGAISILRSNGLIRESGRGVFVLGSLSSEAA